MLSAQDPETHYEYSYDVLNRTLTADNAGTPGAPHVELTYGYDAVGNVLTTADNLGVTVSSTYDQRDLLINRSWSGPNLGASAAFSYNDRGERTGLMRFSDSAGLTKVGSTTYGYDDVGRMTDIAHFNAVDAVLASYDYHFDLAGQLTSETNNGHTTSYSYDPAGELTSADHAAQPDEQYSYDADGNRIGDGYVVGSNNQIAADAAHTYTYDAEGNLLTKTETASGHVTTYSYDYRNRLVEVEEKNSAGNVIERSEFTYDVFDHRIAKTTDADGDGPQPATTARYVFDGQHVWADFDEAGSLTARYLYADDADDILARFHPADGVAWYLTDHLGTVRDIAGSTGGTIDHIDYDSFGNVIAESSPTYGDRVKFTGRELDAETGLYYYRARYYDPSTGRFISQDPISFYSGDPNLYRYVHNQPLTAVDPTGPTEFAFTAGALAYDLKLAETVNGYTFGYTCGWLDAFYRGEPDPTASAMQASIVGMATGLTLSAMPVKYALFASVAFAIAGVNSIADAAAQGNEPLFIIRTICFTAPLARTVVRGFTSSPQLKFGDNDLVYGPSAKGALRDLQQRAGGKLLTDLPRPPGMDWKAFSQQQIETALKNGDKIHVDLTNMKDIPNFMQGKGPYADSTTAFEMRYMQANWDRFSSAVNFYLNGTKVSEPW